MTGQQHLCSDRVAICSLLLILLTFTRANWYFEVTEMIDQGISNYVYDSTCLKNDKGGSSYLILISTQSIAWFTRPNSLNSNILIFGEQHETICFFFKVKST